MSTQTLKAERENVMGQAQRIAESAKAAGRGFTSAEREQIDRHMKRLDDLDGQIKDAVRTDAIMGLVGDPPAGQHGFIEFDTKSIGDGLVNRPGHLPGSHGIKALVAGGDSLVGLPLLAGTPVDLGKIATDVFDVIPAQQVPREFAYLRQTARTNAAAVVASGALKPTSTYTLQRVEDHLRVIAHLSEPIDKFWLEDGPTLAEFVSTELVYGLKLGLESQILNGNGLSDNLTGLNVTSGIQAQAFTTDMITTARNALTQAQTAVGEGPGFYVFNPLDWAVIELTTVGSAYAMNSAGASVPVDQAARRLWGQPVVLSNAQAVGTALSVQRDAVRVFVNGQIRVEWSTSSSDDFERNRLRARCEGRFGFAVPRPLGVVKLDLTA